MSSRLGTATIPRDELHAWKTVAAIADTMLWPCRRHKPEGCGDRCTACRMVDALHAVGLGHDLKKGTQHDRLDVEEVEWP